MTKSEQMARVRSRDTAPERVLRGHLYSYGVRYRLHRKDLPGSPDIYVSRLRLAIFVNGCFWHGHDCSRGRRPTSNAAFWNAKIDKNLERDRTTAEALSTLAIESITVWTCTTKRFEDIAREVARRYKSVIA